MDMGFEMFCLTDPVSYDSFVLKVTSEHDYELAQGPVPVRRLGHVRAAGSGAPAAGLEDPRLGLDRCRAGRPRGGLGVLRRARHPVQVRPQSGALLPEVRAARRQRSSSRSTPPTRPGSRSSSPSIGVVLDGAVRLGLARLLRVALRDPRRPPTMIATAARRRVAGTGPRSGSRRTSARVRRTSAVRGSRSSRNPRRATPRRWRRPRRAACRGR